MKFKFASSAISAVVLSTYCFCNIATAGVIQTHFEYQMSSIGLHDTALEYLSNSEIGYKNTYLERNLGLTTNILNEGGKIRFKETQELTSPILDDEDVYHQLGLGAMDVAILLDDSNKLDDVYSYINNNQFDKDVPREKYARYIHANNPILKENRIKTSGQKPLSVEKTQSTNNYDNLFEQNNRQGYFLEYEYFLQISADASDFDFGYLNYAEVEYTNSLLKLMFTTAKGYLGVADINDFPSDFFALDMETQYEVNQSGDIEIEKNWKLWFESEEEAQGMQESLLNQELTFNDYMKGNSNHPLYQDVTYQDNYGCIDNNGDAIPDCHLSSVGAQFNLIAVPEPSSYSIFILALMGLGVRRFKQ